MKKISLAAIMLLFLTSFAGDTSKPVKKTLIERLFNLRAKGELIRADTKVSLLMTKMVIDSTNVLLDSLKVKNDSLTKK